jgi:hypothetical protein
MFWGPAKNKECMRELNSLSELNKIHKEFAANSKYLTNYDGPLFKSWKLGNFELSKDFPGSEYAAELPEKIMDLIGISENDKPFVGAYPANP